MTANLDGKLGLPIRPFFYTVDQIAMLIEVDDVYVKRSLLYYMGRTVGPCPRDKMKAIDISPDSAEKPEWRVPERDFMRWLRFKGVKISNRGYVS